MYLKGGYGLQQQLVDISPLYDLYSSDEEEGGK